MHGPAPRVLVTGAAGFIGSHLAQRLSARGDVVSGIDNLDPYYSPILKQENIAIIEAAGASYTGLDVLERDALHDFVSDFAPDVVVHLAARAGVRNSIEHPHDYVMTNLVGAQNVFDACLAGGCSRVILASTSSVYGNSAPTPFLETYEAVHPQQPYAASKRAAELLAYTYFQMYGLSTTVTRFFTVYGPRGRPDMMPLKLTQSMTTGEEIPLFEGDLRRDWTYVGDICDGLAAAVSTPLGFEIINLGRGQPESLADFIAEMQRVSGKEANLKPTARPASEMMTTWADISKARDLLGYSPKVSMDEGIRATWDWFSSSRVP